MTSLVGATLYSYWCGGTFEVYDLYLNDTPPHRPGRNRPAWDPRGEENVAERGDQNVEKVVFACLYINFTAYIFNLPPAESSSAPTESPHAQRLQKHTHNPPPFDIRGKY